MNSKKEKGQVVLIVLLISTLLLTLGLSASRQTTVETKISTDEELLKQAFDAAESGIDYYLGTSSTIGYSSPDLKTKADVTVTNIGENQTIGSDGLVLTDTPFLFWLVNHDVGGNVGNAYYSAGSGSVDICVDSNFGKSLKVDYFYYDETDENYKVNHSEYNFDSNNNDLIKNLGDGYKLTSSGGCISSVALTGDSLLLVVTPIGGQTKITVKSGSSSKFPIQGQEITSVGKAGNVSANAVSTRISVINRYDMPAFMLEAVSSSGGIN